jgi:hypothetical protein
MDKLGRTTLDGNSWCQWPQELLLNVLFYYQIFGKQKSNSWSREKSTFARGFQVDLWCQIIHQLEIKLPDHDPDDFILYPKLMKPQSTSCMVLSILNSDSPMWWQNCHQHHCRLPPSKPKSYLASLSNSHRPYPRLWALKKTNLNCLATHMIVTHKLRMWHKL